MVHYIGISKSGVINEDTVIDVLNEACLIKNVKEMNIDFSSDFVSKTINIDGDPYDFIEIQIDNEFTILNDILKGILEMGIPCYRGDVYYKTVYPTIYEKGIIVHAPDEHGNVEGGISVTKTIKDMQCGIEFPTMNFSDNEPVIKYFPLDLKLPTTYADFMREAQRVIVSKHMGEKEYEEFLEKQLVFLGNACIIYDPKLVWVHEIPETVDDVMKSIPRVNLHSAVTLMSDDLLEWLGISFLKDKIIEVERQIPMEEEDLAPIFGFLEEFLFMNNDDRIARVLASLTASHIRSGFRGKHVRFYRRDNKFIFEIVDDDDFELMDDHIDPPDEPIDVPFQPKPPSQRRVSRARNPDFTVEEVDDL